MSRLPKAPDVRFPDLAATALFVVVSIALYWPVFEGRVPLPTDITLEQPIYRTTAFFPDPGPHAGMENLTGQIYPWRHYATETLEGGSFPEWNARTLGGAPFIANAQSAVFYPPHFLYWLVEIPTAWSLLFILHLAMAGIFTFFFLKEIKCEPLAAVGGGLVFAMCGFMTAWRGDPVGAAATWLPLVALAVARLRRARGAGPIVLAAFAFTMPVLAGHPQTAAHVTVAGLAIAAFEFSRPYADGVRPRRLRSFGFFLFAALLAVVLASIQWLPTLEWISMTVRNLDARWPALPVSEAVTFLSRDVSADPSADGVSIPAGAGYVGILPLVLAPIAIIGLGGYGAFFAALTVMAASAAYGIGPVGGILGAVPVLGGLETSRFLLVVDFSLAVLVGIGLTVVTRAPEKETKSWMIVPLLAAIAGGGIYGLVSPDDGIVAELAVLSVILVFLRSARVLGGTSFLAVAVVLLVADLATFSYGFLPFVERGTIYPDAPAITFLEDTMEAGERAVFVDDVGEPNLAMLGDVETLSGNDNVLFPLRAFLSGYAASGFGGLTFTGESIMARSDRRLDMLNVRYLVAPTESAARLLASDPDRFRAVFVDGPVAVLENQRALPRAFLVPAGGMEFVRDWREGLERVREPGFDPVDTVILPFEPGFARASLDEPAIANEVEITEYAGDRMRLEVRTAVPSVLVIGQVPYPGWSVTVNGIERNVLEADFALTGVGLDAGSHVVELAFGSRAVRTGAALSLAGMLLIISLIVVEHRLPFFARNLDRREAEEGSVLAVIGISLIAVMYTGLLVTNYYRPRPAPAVRGDLEMEVRPAEVSPGEGGYTIRFDGLWDTLVPVRYTVDDGRVEVRTVYLDREGDQGVARVDVPADAAPGEYRFVGVKLPGTRRWVEVEGSVTVR